MRGAAGDLWRKIKGRGYKERKPKKEKKSTGGMGGEGRRGKKKGTPNLAK